MTFNSLIYFLFLPAIWLIFSLTPDRWRWLVLLVASYGFYAALNAPYLLMVLLMVTAISYACGLRMAAPQDETGRKRWLWIGVAACVGILVLLKYLPVPGTWSTGIFGLDDTVTKMLIIVGVSYYSLQAISYLADVYLGIGEPEKDFGRYALYLAFFPKLLQGPIERASVLLPQLKKPYEFDYDNMRTGLLLFAWGLFKKVVIADRLNLMVNHVYNNVHAFSGFTLILATYLYALQIYFDFSGYTDMALGSARIFNIRLAQNFNAPYLATSIADFWRRWHISFSRWLLDYIFKPLQMQFRYWSDYGTALALLVTFLVSGMWHGANWTFVVWGLIHGIYLASSVLYKPLQKTLFKGTRFEKSIFREILQVFVTFNLISFAWVFFRSRTLSDAGYIISHLFTGADGNINSLLMVSGKVSLVILTMSLMIVLIVTILMKLTHIQKEYFERLIIVRWAAYYGLGLLLLTCGIDGDNVFVYFNF